MVQTNDFTGSPRDREPPQRVVLHRVSWEDYERVLAIRGEGAGPRISYLDGELELMSPSRDHESIKTELGRLLEAYAEEMDIDLNGFGSMTLKDRPKKIGVEPDECYVIGKLHEVPDIAIEVVWTNAAIDKLELYKLFGVREVWIWRDERIEIHALRGAGYERVAKSEVLPELDLSMIATFVGRPSQTAAVREFRALLRSGAASR